MFLFKTWPILWKANLRNTFDFPSSPLFSVGTERSLKIVPFSSTTVKKLNRILERVLVVSIFQRKKTEPLETKKSRKAFQVGLRSNCGKDPPVQMGNHSGEPEILLH